MRAFTSHVLFANLYLFFSVGLCPFIGVSICLYQNIVSSDVTQMAKRDMILSKALTTLILLKNNLSHQTYVLKVVASIVMIHHC
jgi:Na+-translocating ferredoxin:NAD+ oxidoreductase RnfA subunit